MGRPDITKLPFPSKRYRAPAFGTAAKFETGRSALAEDVRRAKLATSAAALASNPENKAAAQALAWKLSYLSRKDPPPTSPASFAYMREQRICVAGALWKLCHETASVTGLHAPRSVTILRESFEVSPKSLSKCGPDQFLNPIRMDLYRCGAAKADGAFYAGLHGEYEPRSSMLRIHLHGLAIGEMSLVVNRLRSLPMYAPIVRRIDAVEKRVPSIRIKRIRTDDGPGPFTYPIQSFWPSRWEGLIDGKLRRQSFKSRMSEPVHTQVLLWLDRWRLKDLTLRVRLNVTEHGFVITKPKA